MTTAGSSCPPLLHSARTQIRRVTSEAKTSRSKVLRVSWHPLSGLPILRSFPPRPKCCRHLSSPRFLRSDQLERRPADWRPLHPPHKVYWKGLRSFDSCASRIPSPPVSSKWHWQSVRAYFVDNLQLPTAALVSRQNLKPDPASQFPPHGIYWDGLQSFDSRALRSSSPPVTAEWHWQRILISVDYRSMKPTATSKTNKRPPIHQPRVYPKTPKSWGPYDLSTLRPPILPAVPERPSVPKSSPDLAPTTAAHLLKHLRAALAWRASKGQLDSLNVGLEYEHGPAKALFPGVPEPASFPGHEDGKPIQRWDCGQTAEDIQRRAAIFASDDPAPSLSTTQAAITDGATDPDRLQPNPFKDNEKRAVLLLCDVSRSLILSDFLRIGRQGDHIEGWNSGLAEVLQDLDPISLEPQGQFFLVFHSEGAACQWEDDARRRHALNRHTTSNVIGHKARNHRAVEPSHDDSLKARSYSLTPPDYVSLRIKRGGSDGVAQQLQQRIELRTELRRKLRANDLVLLSLVRGCLTKSELGQLIEDDARDMNYSWSIVRVLAWNKDDWSPWPLRFVMSFALADDAQRFVRWWHGRVASFKRLSSESLASAGLGIDEPFASLPDDDLYAQSTREQEMTEEVEVSAVIIS